MEFFIGERRCTVRGGALEAICNGIIAEGDRVVFGSPDHFHAQPQVGDSVIVLRNKRQIFISDQKISVVVGQ